MRGIYRNYIIFTLIYVFSKFQWPCNKMSIIDTNDNDIMHLKYLYIYIHLEISLFTKLNLIRAGWRWYFLYDWDYGCRPFWVGVADRALCIWLNAKYVLRFLENALTEIFFKFDDLFLHLALFKYSHST